MTAITDSRRTTSFQWLFERYDRLWRRLHGVRQIDALLSLSIGKYRGPPRTLPGGVHLEKGDCLGNLHFNHEFFADPTDGTGANMNGALRFRRQLYRSLMYLARRMADEPELDRVKVFHGVNWFPPHGEKAGFVVERLPDGFRTRLLMLHFRLYLKAFFPTLASRQQGSLHPHAYWLTRKELFANFGSLPDKGH